MLLKVVPSRELKEAGGETPHNGVNPAPGDLL